MNKETEEKKADIQAQTAQEANQETNQPQPPQPEQKPQQDQQDYKTLYQQETQKAKTRDQQ